MKKMQLSLENSVSKVDGLVRDIEIIRIQGVNQGPAGKAANSEEVSALKGQVKQLENRMT